MIVEGAYLILIAAAAVTYLVVCVADRRAALIVFCALLPTYLLRFTIPLPGVGIPTTILEILFCELVLAWFVAVGRKPGAWSGAGRYAGPIAMLLSAAIVSILVSPDLRAAGGLLRAYVLEPLLFFIVFMDIVRDERVRGQVLGALACTLAVVGITAVVQKITGFGIPNPFWAAEATRRVTSFYGFPNAIGLFATPVTVLCFGRALALFHERKRLRAALSFAACALGWSAMLFAVSEGALIGAFIATVLLMLWHRKLRAVALAILIAGSLAAIAVPRVQDYLTNAVTLRDDSGSVRRIVWSETWAMLQDHPVFGAGLSGYRSILAAYHKAPGIEIFMYPHDIVLNFWSELGLVGLAAFIWIFVAFFAGCARAIAERKENLLAMTVLCAMLALIIHGLVDVPYFKNDLAMLFWIIVGLAESMRLYPPKVTVVHALQDLADRATLGRH